MVKKNLTIKDTLDGSVKQHDFFKGKWKPLVKENAIDKTLWLVGELGEVIDIELPRARRLGDSRIFPYLRSSD